MADSVSITANVVEGSSLSSNVTDGSSIVTNVSEGVSVAGQVAVGGKGDKGDTGEQGPQGEVGPQGPQGDDGLIQSVVAGTNVTIDSTDPANPIISTGSNVVGASSSTDNAVVRFDGITGKLLQNSTVTINDAGEIRTENDVWVGVGEFPDTYISDGLVSSNQLSASDSILTPAVAGLNISGLTLDSETGSNGTLIKSAGVTVLSTIDGVDLFAHLDLGMTSHKITSLANGTTSTDAVNKGQMDTLDAANVKLTGAQTVAGVKTFTSAPKVDTISENTAANGVTIDGLNIKDNKLNTNDSVVTTNITDANVTSAKLADNAVTTAKITDVNVTTAKIADSAITTAKLNDGAVTSAKLAEAFFKGRKQASTTNSDVSGLKFMHGWGFIQGNGATGMSETVTFPTAFSSPPVVLISQLSAAATASGTPADVDAFNTGWASATGAMTEDITSSSFLAVLRASAVHSSSFYFGYSWIAIGAA